MDAAIRRRQKWLIFFCWLIYTGAYFGRYSYTANVAAIIDAFGTTKADAGLVTSCFFFAYGAGQVVNGILCRHYPKKYVLAAVMIVSAALNLAIFFGVPFYLIKYFWILNGFVQSVLWSSLVLLLSENTDGKMMRNAIVAMSTTTASGTVLSYGAASLFNAFLSFRYSFLLGGIVLTAVGIVWFFAYDRVTVTQCGFVREKEGSDGAPVGKRQKNAAFLVLLISLAIFAVVDNFVRDGVTTWTPVVLKDEYGLPDSLSILLTLVLPTISIFGATTSVLINKYVKDYVSLTGIFFGVATLGIAAIVFLLHTDAWLAMLLVCAVVAMMMSAINNVITGIAPMHLHQYINSGALSGILNGFCYLGSTLSSYGIGLLADRNGWSVVFTVPLAICALPAAYALLRIPILFYLRKKASE